MSVYRSACSVVIALVMVACAAPTTSVAPSVLPGLSPSPSVAASVPTSPSPSQSPSVPAIASYSAAGPCSITLDRAPVLNKTVYFSGAGFTPGTYLNVTFDGPTGKFDFPGKGNPRLLIKSDGTLAPWDVTFDKPAEVGAWNLKFSDGKCEATAFFSVAAA